MLYLTFKYLILIVLYFHFCISNVNDIYVLMSHMYFSAVLGEPVTTIWCLWIHIILTVSPFLESTSYGEVTQIYLRDIPETQKFLF